MLKEKDEIQNKLDQADKLIESGASFQNLKNFKNAIQCYTTAITLYSEAGKNATKSLANAYIKRGFAYLKEFSATSSLRKNLTIFSGFPIIDMALLHKVKNDCDQAKKLGDNSHDLVQLYLDLYQESKGFWRVERQARTYRDVADYCLDVLADLARQQLPDLDTTGRIIKICIENAEPEGGIVLTHALDAKFQQSAKRKALSNGRGNEKMTEVDVYGLYKTHLHPRFDAKLLQLFKNGMVLFGGRGTEKLTEAVAYDLYKTIMSKATRHGFYLSALYCLLIVLQTNALPKEKLNYKLLELNNALAKDPFLFKIVEEHPQALTVTNLLITHVPDNFVQKLYDKVLSDYSKRLKELNNQLKAEKAKNDLFLANGVKLNSIFSNKIHGKEPIDHLVEMQSYKMRK